MYKQRAATFIMTPRHFSFFISARVTNAQLSLPRVQCTYHCTNKEVRTSYSRFLAIATLRRSITRSHFTSFLVLVTVAINILRTIPSSLRRGLYDWLKSPRSTAVNCEEAKHAYKWLKSGLSRQHGTNIFTVSACRLRKSVFAIKAPKTLRERAELPHRCVRRGGRGLKSDIPRTTTRPGDSLLYASSYNAGSTLENPFRAGVAAYPQAEKPGSYKGDTATRIMYAIVTKSKALNCRTALCCVYLRDFQRRPYNFTGGKSIGRFDAGPLSKHGAAPECKGGGKTGDPRVNPPTSGIVRYDFHMRKMLHAGNRTRFKNKLWRNINTATVEQDLCPVAPRSDLRSTQKTVAPFEFRAKLEIQMKFISSGRNWRFEISIRDQQPSSTNDHSISDRGRWCNRALVTSAAVFKMRNNEQAWVGRGERTMLHGVPPRVRPSHGFPEPWTHSPACTKLRLPPPPNKHTLPCTIPPTWNCFPHLKMRSAGAWSDKDYTATRIKCTIAARRSALVVLSLSFYWWKVCGKVRCKALEYLCIDLIILLSPNLNPTEHLWAFLKYRVHSRKVCFEEELKRSVTDESYSISRETYNRQVNSMQRRCWEIIKAKGYLFQKSEYGTSEKDRALLVLVCSCRWPTRVTKVRKSTVDKDISKVCVDAYPRTTSGRLARVNICSNLFVPHHNENLLDRITTYGKYNQIQSKLLKEAETGKEPAMAYSNIRYEWFRETIKNQNQDGLDQDSIPGPPNK
ncbi:hypothetical protein PR048_020513 [Dryococelus australis]|uniref:Uncharacterized protein n=1 Tax=Dryococelus australis TaxID=614101 RepID=A0ABQ9H6W5_9NEOP|nr:hypothetical protein PR048_020513 [Dryococelus australis]